MIIIKKIIDPKLKGVGGGGPILPLFQPPAKYYEHSVIDFKDYRGQ